MPKRDQDDLWRDFPKTAPMSAPRLCTPNRSQADPLQGPKPPLQRTDHTGGNARRMPSIPITVPNDWNQKGCDSRRRNSSRP